MYILIVVLSLPLSCFASENNTTVISDLPEKPILRYGFQYTYDCPDFEKAFICVQKCQDLNYDSATSDKHCKCTCYMKPEILKYKNKPNTTRNDWKSGAPSTKLPIWAQTATKQKNDMHDDTSEDDGENEDKTASPNSAENHANNISGSTPSNENTTTDVGTPKSTVDVNTTEPTVDVNTTEHTVDVITTLPTSDLDTTATKSDVETTELTSDHNTAATPSGGETTASPNSAQSDPEPSETTTPQTA